AAPQTAPSATGRRTMWRPVPAPPGRPRTRADPPRTLMPALRPPRSRKADLAVPTASPERTTADARAMGITGLVGAYETFYGGVPNRIHNVQLLARMIDNHYIAPDEEFSFNRTTGERSEAKGVLEAAVIIN